MADARAKLYVQGEKNALSFEFMATKYSAYSGEASILIISSFESTFDYRSEEYLDEEKGDYNPLEDKFILCGLDINGRTYLQRSINTIKPDIPRFIFPSVENVCDEEIAILGGPDIINGHDDFDALYLGVLTNMHNNISLSYVWILDTEPVSSGPRQCLIKPTKPGEYFCKLFFNDIVLETSRVMVITVEKTTSANQEFQDASENKEPSNCYPPSKSVTSLLGLKL